MSKPILFISHSTKDKEIAKHLAKEFRSRGLEIWIDHEQIQYGQSIPEAIENGLSKSTGILVILSSSFSKSKWCRAEYEPILMEEIQHGNILIVPILIEDCDIPILLSQKRYVDFRNPADRAYQLDELVNQINSRFNLKQEAIKQSELFIHKQSKFVSSSRLVSTLQSTLYAMHPEKLLEKKSASLNLNNSKQLLEEVSRLIEKFEEYFDEIASVLVESDIAKNFYGSAWRVSQSRLLRVNRKLVNISNEMRSIYRNLDKIFVLTPTVKKMIDRVTSICAQISIAEDFLVIWLINNPDIIDFIPDNIYEKFSNISVSKFPDNKRHPSYIHELGIGMLNDYHIALVELNDYKIKLREAINDLIYKPIRERNAGVK